MAHRLITRSCLGQLKNYSRIVQSRYSTSTDVPKIEENVFSDIESKTRNKILEKRQTDMPISNMKNPFEKEKQICVLCKYDVTPDYKNIRLLSQFVSPYTGRIYGRHITGLCKQKQAQVEKEIDRSRNAGLMPIVLKHVDFLKDPKLYDPERPLRPHKF